MDRGENSPPTCIFQLVEVYTKASGPRFVKESKGGRTQIWRTLCNLNCKCEIKHAHKVYKKTIMAIWQSIYLLD